MIEINIKPKYLKILFVILLILLPWITSNPLNELNAELPRQEDLTYYEINPCKISLSEFIFTNFQTAYQDHYQFKSQDRSSISCFGKIAGVYLVNDVFIIYVGTNTFVNLVIQGLFWITLVSFIKKRTIKNIFINKYYYISIISSSYFLTYMIYAEKRYYETKFYLLNLNDKLSYFFIFVLLSILMKVLVDTFLPRQSVLINYFPFLYLFVGVFGGYNFTIYAFFLTFLGSYSILTKNTNRYFNKIYLLFSTIWVLNASNRYSFAPGKLRGFTSTVYDFNAVLSWTVFVFLIVSGLSFFYRTNKKYINIYSITNSFCFTSTFVVLLGYIGANFPIVNFLNYFYSGQQRFGIRTTNPLIVNEWGEKISWRGYYSSAESIGEFYGIAIILLIYLFFKLKRFSILHSVGFLSSVLGLYFSNNRTVFVLVFVAVLILIYKEYRIKKFIGITTLFLTGLVLTYIVGFQNLTLPYSFTSEIIVAEAINYRFDNITSSFLEFTIRSRENEYFFSYIYSFVGFIAYLLNRAELWGIFTSRYNPSDIEILFGSGPLNFGQLYGEIIIENTRSLLLPHSSMLSALTFTGLLGILSILIFVIQRMYKNRKSINFQGFYLIMFIGINLIKNDTLNYFASFSLYLFFLFAIISIKNNKLFSFDRPSL